MPFSLGREKRGEKKKRHFKGEEGERFLCLPADRIPERKGKKKAPKTR